jgi:hypothetical protein
MRGIIAFATLTLRAETKRDIHTAPNMHTRYTRLINSIRTAVGFGRRCRAGGLQDRFRA